jgi:membrane complex biogenesis BtpA family protein
MKRTLPPKAVIGMVHLQALPGTPQSRLAPAEIIRRAAAEAQKLIAGGVDGILLENMHDRPYLKGRAAPETVALMTAAAREVRSLTDRILGIQILAAANREALAVALAADLDFVRVEGFVFGHVADEGYIDGCAGELLRCRREIGAENVRIFADIKKKHSAHAVTADVGLAETARAAEFFLADGVIVTGTRTGVAADLENLRKAKAAVRDIPVLAGSGVTEANIGGHLAVADAVIVGSSLKSGGRWEAEVDAASVERLVAAARNAAAP